MKTVTRGLVGLGVALCAIAGADAAHAQQGGRRGDRGGGDECTLKVGDAAPDFDLRRLAEGESPDDEKKKDDTAEKAATQTVKLSELRGKPVFLVFGSYT